MTGSELAALARLARRGARRNGRRTALIVVLIAVTVAAAVVAAGVVRSNRTDPELAAVSDFGAANLRLGATYATPDMEGWLATHLAGVADQDQMRTRTLHSRLGAGEFGQVSDADLSHPLAESLVTLTSGRPPTAPDEVVLSVRAAEVFGGALGETVELEIGGGPSTAYRVTGILHSPMAMRQQYAVMSAAGFDAAVAAAPSLDVADGGRTYTSNVVYTTWLVRDDGGLAGAVREAWERDRAGFWPEPAVTPKPPELEALTDDVYVMLDAEAVADLAALAPGIGPEALMELAHARIGNDYVDLPWLEVETRDERIAAWSTTESALTAPPVLGTMVATLLLVEVAMVAGAAFATGTRRRLREIGLLGANGATTGHVRHIVVGEGMVVGLAGSGIGVAVGLTLLVLARPIMQRFSDLLLTGMPVEAVDVVGPLVAGVAAATVAAWVPARTASRVSTVTALQGRMPVGRPRRWVPAAGMGLAAVGALMVVVAKASIGDEAAAFLAGLGVVAMIAGAALFAGPLVAFAGGNADRTRATARLVLRDAARQRTRTAAAVAALMVVLIAPVTLGVAMGNEQVKSAARGLPTAANHVVVNGEIDWDAPMPEAGAATRDDISQVQDIVGPSEATLFTALDARVLFAAEAAVPGIDPDQVDPGWGTRVALGTPDLARTLGEPRIADHLAAGRPVVLGIADRATTVVLNGTTLDATELPVAVAHYDMPRLLLPANLVEAHDLPAVGVKGLVVAEDITSAERDRVYRLDFYVVTGEPHTLTNAQILWIALGATLLVVLGIVALVTALSAAESDNDIATMVAVGAPPSMRRRFLALQTGFYALLAALLAVPLGWLLMKVTATGGNSVDFQPFGAVPGDIVTVPWATFGFVIVVVPLAVALLTAALTRSARTLPPRPTT